LNRLGIAVLRILNEKDHQESNNCRPGIDNELPRIRIMEHGAGESPNDEDDNRARESPRATKHPRRTPCENSKSIANYTKNLSTLRVR
jgi:hypothetical protein